MSLYGPTFTIRNAGITAFARPLDVRPGDFNDDRSVTKADDPGVYCTIAEPYNVGFADTAGGASDDTTDLVAVRLRNGTTLPPLP
jgi:hypothetical protein